MCLEEEREMSLKVYSDINDPDLKRMWQDLYRNNRFLFPFACIAEQMGNPARDYPESLLPDLMLVPSV